MAGKGVFTRSQAKEGRREDHVDDGEVVESRREGGNQAEEKERSLKTPSAPRLRASAAAGRAAIGQHQLEEGILVHVLHGVGDDGGALREDRADGGESTCFRARVTAHVRGRGTEEQVRTHESTVAPKHARGPVCLSHRPLLALRLHAEGQRERALMRSIDPFRLGEIRLGKFPT